MKNFSKKELKEKLGFTKEEADIVIEYQKKLPLLNDDMEGFCIDPRQLHTELKINTKFADWIQRRISKYGFEEDVDFIRFLNSEKAENTYVNTKEYRFTVDMAKQLAMAEGNEYGKVVRKYFITIEKAFKRIVEWNMIREPERETYKQMCEELDKYTQRNFNKRPNRFDYINEAEALNLVCLGAKSKDIRAYLEVQDKNTRDHLFKEYNEYLYEMQKLNIMYLKMNMEKMRRYDLIKQGFKALYPHASFIIANEFIKKQNNEFKII